MNRVLSLSLILSAICKAPANCVCFAKLYHKVQAHSMFRWTAGTPNLPPVVSTAHVTVVDTCAFTCSAMIMRNGSYAMLLKITSKRHVTLPAHVLDAMGVGPGDILELIESPDGYLLRPRRIDYSRLGSLREQIPDGHPSFSIRTFREKPYDPALRN